MDLNRREEWCDHMLNFKMTEKYLNREGQLIPYSEAVLYSRTQSSDYRDETLTKGVLELIQGVGGDTFNE